MKYVEWVLVAMIVLVQVLMVTGCGADEPKKEQPIGLQSTINQHPEGSPSPTPSTEPTVEPTPSPMPTPSPIPVYVDPWVDMQNTWLDRGIYWHDTEHHTKTDPAMTCIKGWHIPTADDVATLIPGRMPLPNGYAWVDDGTIFNIPNGNILSADKTGGLARVICVKKEDL